MTAGDILRHLAKAQGHTEEQIAYAENTVRSASPGFLEREISEQELPEFLAVSRAIAAMPATALIAHADQSIRQN